MAPPLCSSPLGLAGGGWAERAVRERRVREGSDAMRVSYRQAGLFCGGAGVRPGGKPWIGRLRSWSRGEERQAKRRRRVSGPGVGLLGATAVQRGRTPRGIGGLRAGAHPRSPQTARAKRPGRADCIQGRGAQQPHLQPVYTAASLSLSALYTAFPNGRGLYTVSEV